MNTFYRAASLGSLLCALATPVAAYIGPGAGLSLLGAVWGLLAAVVAAVGFIVLWPIRKRRRRRRMLRERSQQSPDTHEPPGDTATRDTAGDVHAVSSTKPLAAQSDRQRLA